MVRPGVVLVSELQPDPDAPWPTSAEVGERLRASHPVRTLLEERVGAPAVAEIVVPPRFIGRCGTGGDRTAVDEDFDSADIAANYPASLCGLARVFGVIWA
jgi:hypothetical protein